MTRPVGRWAAGLLGCVLCAALVGASCQRDRDHVVSAVGVVGQSGGTSWHEVAGLRVLEVEAGAHDAILPMVVFIHGRGDIANPGWIESFDAHARYEFPQAPTPYGGGFSWFTYDRDADPKTQARDIARAADGLALALGELARTRPTLGKPIVAGFSQGGMLAYALALLHPETIAFAVPISGMLPPPLYAQLPRGGVHYPRVRALHGTDDGVVPFAPTARMVELLQQRGLDIRLTKYPGVRHEVNGPMRTQMLSLVREALQGARDTAATGGTHLKPTEIP